MIAHTTPKSSRPGRTNLPKSPPKPSL